MQNDITISIGRPPIRRLPQINGKTNNIDQLILSRKSFLGVVTHLSAVFLPLVGVIGGLVEPALY